MNDLFIVGHLQYRGLAKKVLDPFKCPLLGCLPWNVVGLTLFGEVSEAHNFMCVVRYELPVVPRQAQE